MTSFFFHLSEATKKAKSVFCRQKTGFAWRSLALRKGFSASVTSAFWKLRANCGTTLWMTCESKETLGKHWCSRAKTTRKTWFMRHVRKTSRRHQREVALCHVPRDWSAVTYVIWCAIQQTQSTRNTSVINLALRRCALESISVPGDVTRTVGLAWSSWQRSFLSVAIFRKSLATKSLLKWNACHHAQRFYPGVAISVRICALMSAVWCALPKLWSPGLVGTKTRQNVTWIHFSIHVGHLVAWRWSVNTPVLVRLCSKKCLISDSSQILSEISQFLD